MVKRFGLDQPVHSLYIHWPFCPYKCHFCPFVALAGHDHFMDRYHEALKKEIETFGKERVHKVPLKTVFFGGGTPSTYPLHLLLDTFDILKGIYGLDPQAEISIEVNPGTITNEKLEVWKDMGINRLSIGVQSLNDKVLSGLNRHQRASDVHLLLEKAQKLYSNLSVDLIVGLPGVSSGEWKELISTVVSWPITHVSLYFLTVHEDTPLYFGVKAQKILLPPEEAIVDLYLWSIEQLARAGFMQYEISNFARSGHISYHNSVYWQRKPYKGLGLGACSFDGHARFQNEKSLLKYLEGIEGELDVTVFSEELTQKQAWLEMLMLGLRQTRGVVLKEILHLLSEGQKKAFFQAAATLVEAGLLAYNDEHAYLTLQGLAVANEVIVKLSCV